MKTVRHRMGSTVGPSSHIATRNISGILPSATEPVVIEDFNSGGISLRHGKDT